MTTVVVEFDGTTFVPQQPVDLPVGTLGTVAIPELHVSESAVTTDDPEWQNIVAQIRSSEPDPPTVEEAMRQMRNRPKL